MTFSVLHIASNRAWGGGENQVRLLMRELQRAGVRQLCICPANSPLAERLSAEHLPIHPAQWTSGSDPRAFVSIARMIRSYDIAHCHDAHALQLAILPAKLSGKRLVASRRVRFKTSALKWNRADVVVAVSQTVRAELIRSGVDAKRIVVIHSGTDAEETRAVPAFTPPLRDQLGIPANHFMVGNAGALYEAKGQTLIPEAAGQLPDVHWLIAGEGPQRATIEAAIRKYGVEDRVHMLGWLPDARRMLKELDAYVSTSTDDGLGNSMTEALALHIPIVAADAGGPGEIMRPVHQRTRVVLFEPRSAHALVDAITRLRAPGVRAQVIAAQDERFADFTIERTAAATLALYRELLGK